MSRYHNRIDGMSERSKLLIRPAAFSRSPLSRSAPLGIVPHGRMLATCILNRPTANVSSCSIYPSCRGEPRQELFGVQLVILSQSLESLEFCCINTLGSDGLHKVGYLVNANATVAIEIHHLE